MVRMTTRWMDLGTKIIVLGDFSYLRSCYICRKGIINPRDCLANFEDNKK